MSTGPRRAPTGNKAGDGTEPLSRGLVRSRSGEAGTGPASGQSSGLPPGAHGPQDSPARQRHSKAQSQVGGRTGPSHKPPLLSKCPPAGLTPGRCPGSCKRPSPILHSTDFHWLHWHPGSHRAGWGSAFPPDPLPRQGRPVHCREDWVVGPRQGLRPHSPPWGVGRGTHRPPQSHPCKAFCHLLLSQRAQRGQGPPRGPTAPQGPLREDPSLGLPGRGPLQGLWRRVPQSQLKLALVSRPSVSRAGRLRQACAPVSLFACVPACWP